MFDCPIWIVDDDVDDLELIAQAFKDCSFNVKVFTSSQAPDVIPALESTYRSDLPQVILLDINMPLISGKALLGMIRSDERFRHIPVVMFTTSNSRKDRIECLQAGANSFLTKPVNYQQMVKICSSVATVFCSTEISNYS